MKLTTYLTTLALTVGLTLAVAGCDEDAAQLDRGDDAAAADQRDAEAGRDNPVRPDDPEDGALAGTEGEEDEPDFGMRVDLPDVDPGEAADVDVTGEPGDVDATVVDDEMQAAVEFPEVDVDVEGGEAPEVTDPGDIDVATGDDVEQELREND